MVQVKTSDGFLEGEKVNNEYGGTFYSFKGIPYAEPPLGDLRFKAPEPVKPWNGIRIAKSFGPVCYQRDFPKDKLPNGSEDCLYLNVYTPNLKPATPLPVMVWIHGGGFIWGSGNDSIFGPEYLIRHGVIIVTFNYRLGVLGFLSLNTEGIPGNAGIKDQVLALKWVNKNISCFGGDPKNITIFGESAGGTNVAFHLVSPMSKGLFKRAIVQSGCALNFWATPFEAREKALKLARQLGFFSENNDELDAFFKEQPLETFIDLDLQIRIAKKPYDIDFGIVSEKKFGNNERFFFGDIVDMIKNYDDAGIEIMTGYTEHEGLMAFAVAKMKNKLDDLFTMSNEFIEFYVPKEIALETPSKQHVKIGRRFKDFYIKHEINSIKNFGNLLNYLNMEFFAYDILKYARLYARNKSNTIYLYKFTCKSDRNQGPKMFAIENLVEGIPLVCHVDDLMYLFPFRKMNPKVKLNSETFKLIENVTKLWTNFAKYGNPTPDDALGVKWLPYTVKDQHYLDIGNKLKPGTSPDKDDVEFWDSMYREYIPGRNTV